MLEISTSLILTTAEIILLVGMVVMCSYYSYQLVTNVQERQVFRTRLSQEIHSRNQKAIQKHERSPFQARLRETGLTFVSAYRFQIIRWSVIFAIAVYYLITPLVQGLPVDYTMLAIPLLLVFITEPKIKFSALNMFLNTLLKNNQSKKMIELFTLFDILKADLKSLNKEQEVNIYNLLSEMLPLFNHIGGTLSRFLSLWKHDPLKAKEVFYEEIGTESSKVLGDILFKLNNTSKETALELIETEAKLFSVSYYESQKQDAVRKRNTYFVFFSVNILLILLWVIFFVTAMFGETINTDILI